MKRGRREKQVLASIGRPERRARRAAKPTRPHPHEPAESDGVYEGEGEEKQGAGGLVGRCAERTRGPSPGRSEADGGLGNHAKAARASSEWGRRLARIGMSLPNRKHFLSNRLFPSRYTPANCCVRPLLVAASAPNSVDRPSIGQAQAQAPATCSAAPPGATPAAMARNVNQFTSQSPAAWVPDEEVEPPQPIYDKIHLLVARQDLAGLNVRPPRPRRCLAAHVL